MNRGFRTAALAALAPAVLASAGPNRGVAAQARVSEEVLSLTTYPFSEPDPVPLLASDARLHPYHAFRGYAHDPVTLPWRVVKLENDLIEVYVLPEMGGKVWGAVVKETGHEFIYRNEVAKFRDIALRGPWTSGGIEFNFGVIGHTPATATPVDYETRVGEDGSASVVVGATDLPSRTRWRVEVRLPPDRAYFETRVLWHNPTPFEQPYYNWMTGAAFARHDLVLTVPGDAYLGHPGERHAWPVDAQGRRLSEYAENRFGGNKSYHVVGAREDFFGGYYRDLDFGFGHWARHEEMPGRKIWLWALSRQGGIWEDLLTDEDGQYVEFQAGRQLVQYQPGDDLNPITRAGFDPGATDRWTETWFPVEGLGGLSDASREGAMHVERTTAGLVVRAHAFGAASDTLRVSSEGRVVASEPVRFEPLDPVEWRVALEPGARWRVELPALRLAYASDPSATEIARPFETDAQAWPTVPETDRRAWEASELVQGRRLADARRLYESVLEAEPWHREALLGLAELEARRGRYAEGLALARRALQLDTYDARANFVAGTLYRALGRRVDAQDAYGWAVRDTRYRSAAYVYLAELSLEEADPREAARYAELASDYDRYNPSALQVAALAARGAGDAAAWREAVDRLAGLDPLDPFVRAERHLAVGGEASARALLDALRGEYPEQELLELAIGYVRRGAPADAEAVLALASRRHDNPLLAAWRARLAGDPSALPRRADTELVLPYRLETLPVLEWADEASGHWSWSYLRAIALWALDRADEADSVLAALGDAPEWGPAYTTRALLARSLGGGDPEADLRRAVELSPEVRRLRMPLVEHLQAEGRWGEARSETARALEAFPGDFELGLLHARSLVELSLADSAIALLATIRVLPSEHAAVSHPLFVQAHVLEALAAIEAGVAPLARAHLRTALEWPERLGVGRPYEPEERLVRYLLGAVEAREGDASAARRGFEEVAAATGSRVAAPPDLLAIAALRALGREDEARALEVDGATPAGRFAAAWIAASGDGANAAAAATALAPAHADLFSDLDGRLLLRALTLRLEPPGAPAR